MYRPEPPDQDLESKTSRLERITAPVDGPFRVVKLSNDYRLEFWDGELLILPPCQVYQLFRAECPYLRGTETEITRLAEQANFIHSETPFTGS